LLNQDTLNTDLLRDIEYLLKAKSVRTSDRAYMRSLWAHLKDGKSLTQTERSVLWSYLERYRPLLADARQGPSE
jgi:hypothetical protein